MELQHETRRILELFVQYANEMRDYSFVKKLVADKGVHFNIQYERGAGGTMQVTHPDAEQTRSLVLTLRMFKQNDSISLKNLPKLYTDEGLSKEWIAQVDNTRAVFKAFSDAKALVRFGDDHPTNGEVLDLILYGELAHPDVAKAERVARWRVGEVADMMTNFAFQGVVVELLHAIWFLADITELELKGEPVPALA